MKSLGSRSYTFTPTPANAVSGTARLRTLKSLSTRSHSSKTCSSIDDLDGDLAYDTAASTAPNLRFVHSRRGFLQPVRHADVPLRVLPRGNAARRPGGLPCHSTVYQISAFAWLRFWSENDLRGYGKARICNSALVERPFERDRANLHKTDGQFGERWLVCRNTWRFSALTVE